MYSVFADDICIYDDKSPSDLVTLINPKLTLAENSAGSFSFTMPSTNAGYEAVQRMKTEISVKRNNEEIWAGRVITEDKDYWNNRKLTCEGELAYLNDVLQPPAAYYEWEIRPFINKVLANYNSKADEKRKFNTGIVTVEPYTYGGYLNEGITCTTNLARTFEVLKTNLLDRYGGHFRVRKNDGLRYLDYINEYPNRNTQEIDFHTNLIDFTRNWDDTDIATVIIPYGKKIEDDEDKDKEGLDYKITKTRAPVTNGLDVEFQFTFNNPGVPADYYVTDEDGNSVLGQYDHFIWLHYWEKGSSTQASAMSERWTMKASTKTNKTWTYTVKDLHPEKTYVWRAWVERCHEGDVGSVGYYNMGGDFDTGEKEFSVYFTDGELDGIEHRVTIKSVNDGKDYVVNQNALDSFGWIEKVVTWDRAETPSQLLVIANNYLSDYQFDTMTIELRALDLNYYDIDYESIKLLDEIYAVSRPHGLAKIFPVTKLDIPLDNPANTVYTLGSAKKESFTGSSNETKNDVYSLLGKMPDSKEILKEIGSAGYKMLVDAFDNASQLLDTHTNGYITITTDDRNNDSNELWITNSKDYKNASQFWRWNMNGLGHGFVDSNGNRTYNIAITMDGSIVADFIKVGQMSADRVKLFGLMAVYDQFTGTTPGGYIGYGRGLIGGSVWGNPDSYTDGIMISNTRNTDAQGGLAANPRYFICTTAGVRMNADAQSFYLTDGDNGSNGALIISNTFTFRASALHVYPPINPNDGPSDIAQTGTIKFGDGWLLVNKGLIVNYAESSNVSGYFAGSDASNTVINGSSTIKGKVSDAVRYSASSSEAYMQYDANTLFKVGSYGTQMQYDEHILAKCNSYGFEAHYSDTCYVAVNDTFARLQKDNSTYFEARNDYALMQFVSDKYVKVHSGGVNLLAGSYQAWVSTNTGFGYSSDRRIKHDIVYDVDGDLIDDLKPAKFKFNGSDTDSYGFIAQDVQNVIPEVVCSTIGENEENLLGLKYLDLIAVLTAKVQSQTKKINELEERLSKLEKIIGEL